MTLSTIRPIAIIEHPPGPAAVELPYVPVDVDVALNPYSPPVELPQEEEGQGVAEGEAPLNPWLSIWTRPRATMRQIVDSDPTRCALLLATLSGISNMVSHASLHGWGDRMPLEGILLASTIFGVLLGVPALYVCGWLLRETGRTLGGVATACEVRAAIAWSSLPVVCSLAVWSLLLPVCGIELFRTEILTYETRPGVDMLVFAVGTISITLGVWQIVMWLKCFAEVHRFSVARAIGAYLLAGLAAVGVAILLGFVIGAFVAFGGSLV